MKFGKVIKFFPCLRDLEAAKEQNRYACTDMLCTLRQDGMKLALARAISKTARK